MTEKRNPENDIKSLRYEVNRLSAEVETIRQEHKTSVAPQQTPNQENDTAERKPPLTAQVPPSPANRPQPNNPWYQTLNGWKRFFETIAIPFAIGYAIVTWFQWHDANKNFRVDQRAWIVIGPSQINVKEGEPISFPISFVNGGKSPAFRLKLEARVITLAAGDELRFIYEAPKVNAEDNIVFPNQHSGPIVAKEMRGYANKVQDVNLDSATRSQIIDGKRMIFIYGRFTYFDEFGDPHWYHFCQSGPYITTGSPTETIKTCLSYNTIDND